MKDCEQMKNLSVLEHGISVARHFADLRNHILSKKELKYNWKLPEWVYEKDLWDKLLDIKTVQKYQIYHDCGKPFCVYTDEDGKRHFPNHANVSEAVWIDRFGKSTVSDLIGLDMEIHTLKTENQNDFFLKSEAATLLLTGLTEIHSNAVMFGGLESTSFKIKWKKINKIGKNFLKNLKEIK